MSSKNTFCVPTPDGNIACLDKKQSKRDIVSESIVVKDAFCRVVSQSTDDDIMLGARGGKGRGGRGRRGGGRGGRGNRRPRGRWGMRRRYGYRYGWRYFPRYGWRYAGVYGGGLLGGFLLGRATSMGSEPSEVIETVQVSKKILCNTVDSEQKSDYLCHNDSSSKFDQIQCESITSGSDSRIVRGNSLEGKVQITSSSPLDDLSI